MKTTIVTTTIHVPVLLREYIANVKKYGHSEVDYIIIGDKKTPNEVRDFCSVLAKDSGYHIEYMDVPQQEGYLKKFPELNAHLVYNSIQRRNIGILKAYEQGAEVVITIDDDNFFSGGDFVGDHLRTLGKKHTHKSVSTKTGWFNVCSTLHDETEQPFYHRGYPMKQRWNSAEKEATWGSAEARTVVNAGFWLETPDVDAITHMHKPLNVVRYELDGNFILAKGTWCPFNSQNTALYRDVIPAYFLSPNIGRYDDIWAAYVIVAIAHHLGDSISYGRPLVTQKRNPHNYFKDIELERLGTLLTDQLCDWLNGIQFSGISYGECLTEVIQNLNICVEKETKNLDEEKINFLKKFIQGLEVWERTIARI